jgi:energy-coupling factor transport system permease protein
MTIPVPFGQYVPGTSAIHRADARVKLGLSAVFAVALFGVDSWWGLLVFALFVALSVAVSGVPVRLALRGLTPIAWLLAFTIAANAVRLHSPDALLALGSLGLDGPGLLRGLFFATRVLLLVLGTTVITLTTSPVELTDALSSLLRPLSVLRFPADDAAMMLSIALRFVPTTAEEAERIVVAQTARGARFDEGGALSRARAWVPVLVPLFVRLFRRADDLAVAMESRCYTGRGRTRLRARVMRLGDWLALLAGAMGLVAVALYW